MTEASRPRAARPKRSLFPPLALVAMVVVGMVFSDIYHGYRRQVGLAERNLQLDKSVADSRNVRAQFDALATGLADLAQAGNTNAAAIIASLNKAGVKIKGAL